MKFCIYLKNSNHTISDILPGRTDWFLCQKFQAILLGNMHMGSDEVLASFDVDSSLFTNVPIDKAVSVIRRRFQQDEMLKDRTTLSPDRVVELLELCLRTT